MRSQLSKIVLPVALLVAGATSVSAQTLRGTILDSVTGEPVQLAYVGLLEEGRDLVVAALAANDGSFTLDAPAGGSYFVYVHRSGYEPLMDGLFDIGPDGVFDVRIGLTPRPIELDSVTVEATSMRSPLEVAGFYDRALMSQGHFLIREEIERRAVDRVTDAFRNIPRLEIDATRPLTGPNVMQNPALVMRRGIEQCNPTLYIDRAIVASGVVEPVRPDDFVSPSDVEAVEIYTRQSQIPVGFDAVNDCGVVVIWTRLR